MKLNSLLFGAALLLAGCAAEQAADINPVLSIEGGQVKGLVLDSTNVIVYRGIPYAAAPVGELRWKRPQPVTPWDTVLIADTFSDGATQRIRNPKDGQYGEEFHWKNDDPDYSEDCLYLNVWTPVGAPASDKKLPVAMWVHGGAFSSGFGHEMQFDGVAWAQRDVILVTINYRLNSFGFFSHPELSAEDPDGVSGNQGLFDQIAALKWVKNNIAQFGGDPDNITVFGQSAGGASIRNLCASPLSKDMIAKAIIQSGGGLKDMISTGSDVLTQADYDSVGVQKATAAGYMTLADLRAAPGDTLYKKFNAGWGGGRPAGGQRPAAGARPAQRPAAAPAAPQRPRPVGMGPHLDGVSLTKGFEQATYDGTLADVPYMIGYTADDMGDMSQNILDFAAVRDSLSSHPTYCYKFDRKLPNDGRPCLQGAFHSSELWFVFDTLDRSWRPWTEGDHQLAKEMVDAWTNFCKYGNPNGQTDGAWKASTKAAPYMHMLQVKE